MCLHQLSDQAGDVLEGNLAYRLFCEAVRNAAADIALGDVGIRSDPRLLRLEVKLDKLLERSAVGGLLSPPVLFFSVRVDTKLDWANRLRAMPRASSTLTLRTSPRLLRRCSMPTRY